MSVYTYLHTTKGYIPVYNSVEFPFGEEIVLICGSNYNFWSNYPDYNKTVRYDLVNGNYLEINLHIRGEHSVEGGLKLYDSTGVLIGNLTTSNLAVHKPYRDFLVTLAYDTRKNVFSAANIASTDLYGGAEVSQPGIYPTARGILYNGVTNGAPFISISVFNDWANGALADAVPYDPYNPEAMDDVYTTPGGGEGTFDNTSEPVDIPDLPQLSAADTGLITLYNPGVAELKSLANYLWSDLFDLNTFKKIFADPMSAILGLSIVPVAVPDGGTRDITVGNVSTGVSMTVAAEQYVVVDCGSLNIEEFWGAYLDYDPFTKAEIYLPYIGTHPLAVDDIMGKTVHVVYHVDILSGACCAYVKCGESVLYTFVGQCSCSIPITGNDWTNVINGALSIAASIGTMVATGGATAPMAATAITSAAVNSFKPSVEKSGSLGGMGGMLGVQTPYIILTRPKQALPADQNKLIGYPSYITRQLSSLSGYTMVEDVHLSGIPATDAELAEIETLLKGGVIL